MTPRFIRGWALALALIALPGAASAQEAVLTGTVSDSTGAVLPGVTVVAVNEATGNRFEGVTDERGIYRIPARVGAYRDLRGAVGVHDRDPDRRPAAGRSDGDRQSADGAVNRSGNRDGDSRSAAAQRRDVEPRRATSIREQVRGAAGGRPQLDGAGAARARQPDRLGQRAGAAAGSQQRRGPRVPAQHGRSADLVRAGHRRSAEVQPGLDRRVPVHLEPVRRDAGSLERRPGERDHEVGHATACRVSSAPTSRAIVSTRRIRSCSARCRSATSSTARRSAGRSCATSCTTTATSSTSARRWPASGRRRIPRSTSSSTASSRGRSPARGSTIRCRGTRA